MKSKQNKSLSLILNQINIKGWNWKKKLIKKKTSQLGEPVKPDIHVMRVW